MKVYSHIIVVILFCVTVICGKNFKRIELIDVTDGAIYISSLEFPKTISWENRSECHFELQSKSGNFIFIITNGYLNHVRITYDKAIR